MKIKDFCNRMNDHGTYPHIRVYKHSTITGEPIAIIYEGNPYGVSVEIGNMPVNSFTVRSRGFVVIHTT